MEPEGSLAQSVAPVACVLPSAHAQYVAVTFASTATRARYDTVVPAGVGS
jgi:hypothetical protein